MNFKRLHSWDLTPTEAIEFQNKLKSKIRLVPFNIQPHLVAGVDVSFVL